MLEISRNGIITLNRGDSFILEIDLNIGTPVDPILYYMKDEDKLYFAIMEPNQPFEHALVRKEFTKEDQKEDGDVVMTFSSTDTEFLLPGRYYYSVKLLRKEDENEYIDTVVSKTQFIIID